MKLSVGIITKDEELNLPRTLAAIHEIADEIIIIDNGSEDRTAEIAGQFNASFFTEEWKGYGEQKNSVLKKCRGEWILLIDADEVVTPKLKEQIQSIINSEESQFNVYAIKRRTVCFGKEIKHGGMSGDFVPRLWKNGSVKLSSDIVHEDYITKEKIGKIKEKLMHYTYNSIDEYLAAFRTYSILGGQKYFAAKKKSCLLQVTIRPTMRFIRDYLLRLGFLDGIEGLLLARLSAAQVMIKYYGLRKCYRDEKNQDKNLL